MTVRRKSLRPTARVHALSISFDKGKLQMVTQGCTIAVLVKLVDHDGQPVDPEGLELAIKPPAGESSTVEPVREGVGVYAHAVQLDRAGVWQFRASTTGDCATAVEASLRVKRSELA